MPLPSQKHQSAAPSGSIFRILTVCSGNICRSPQLEMVLEERMPRAFGVHALPQLEVASAGTVARDGAPMDEYAAAEATRLGVPDTTQHFSRRIREKHVEQADLVLGLAREHRADAAGLVPSANRRTFTLVEFARIVRHFVEPLEGIDAIAIDPMDSSGYAAFMRKVVQEAARVRGVMPAPERQEDLDIEDPYRLDLEVYRRSADSIDVLADSVVDDLAALASGSSAR